MEFNNRLRISFRVCISYANLRPELEHVCKKITKEIIEAWSVCPVNKTLMLVNKTLTLISKALTLIRC